MSLTNAFHRSPYYIIMYVRIIHRCIVDGFESDVDPLKKSIFISTESMMFLFMIVWRCDDNVLE